MGLQAPWSYWTPRLGPMQNIRKLKTEKIKQNLKEAVEQMSWNTLCTLYPPDQDMQVHVYWQLAPCSVRSALYDRVLTPGYILPLIITWP